MSDDKSMITGSYPGMRSPGKAYLYKYDTGLIRCLVHPATGVTTFLWSTLNIGFDESEDQDRYGTGGVLSRDSETGADRVRSLAIEVILCPVGSEGRGFSCDL